MVIDPAKILLLPYVEKVSPWKDRHYITLLAVKGSRANADLRTKIWIKGNVLTIETGKGYHSDAFIEQKHSLIDAIKEMGGLVREV